YEIRYPVSIPDYSNCGVNSEIKYYADSVFTIPLTAVNVNDGSYANVFWITSETLPDYDDIGVCASISRFDDEGDCHNFLSGCHNHQKSNCDSDFGMGALFSDLTMYDTAGFFGETGREAKYAYKHSAKASGVVLFTARIQLRDGGYFLENEVYHYDPSDSTRRTLIGNVAFVYRLGIRILGDFYSDMFEELPDSSYCTKLRNPDQNHTDECAFYGASFMVSLITQLSEEYYNYRNQHVGLSINDMSLKYGGVFDLNNDCLNPHWRHRTGESVDINRNGANTRILNQIIRNKNLSLKQIQESTIHYEYGDSNEE
ncbi:MAG: hypothetical protein N2445_01765, partial [Acidobacteria bacterium]|nr:hypothetical protein [Acidobacteriota bacterium]